MIRKATIYEINRAFAARRKSLGRALTVEELRSLDAELAALVERDEIVAGHLQVGVSENGREVIVNHPNLQADANGVGHIVFSPLQARSLARKLLEKADECYTMDAHNG